MHTLPLPPCGAYLVSVRRMVMMKRIVLSIKSWKTSAVSTTVWMVETQFCKLRGTSDTFVGRVYWKIVLLTLAAPRGVTDLYLSWGIHILVEHARTAYHETCGTEYQQSHIVDLIHKHHIYQVLRMESYSTSEPNSSAWRITQFAKLSFKHPSVVLTAAVFQFFIKNGFKHVSCKSTDWMVDIQLWKLRDTSGSFVLVRFAYYMFMNSNYDTM